MHHFWGLFSLSSVSRNIFLGETFSSYISVHNDSNVVARDIVIKVSKWVPLHP